ncbi:MAG: AtpZ/AtpI family protein [Thermodesulfobacteriota bacterium]|nr:AtpZ/AtpI family protein [Thermodesulfobacteriota bacterium]
MENNDKDKDKRRIYLQVADITTMGFAMVISIILGLVVGMYIDNRFGTEPIFTLVLIFCGILAGFRIMYKTYTRFFKEK